MRPARSSSREGGETRPVSAMDLSSDERVRELTGGRALTQQEWMSLLGKGVIAVQEAFERDGGGDLAC